MGKERERENEFDGRKCGTTIKKGEVDYEKND